MTLRPLLEMAGLDMNGRTFSPAQAEKENLERIVDLTNTVMHTNYIGPVLAATAFVRRDSLSVPARSTHAQRRTDTAAAECE